MLRLSIDFLVLDKPIGPAALPPKDRQTVLVSFVVFTFYVMFVHVGVG
jgi:hypothetical protein